MELIFESRENFSEFSGTLHFVQWKPEIHQEPVMLPDSEVDARGVSSYGTVLNDGGCLRMWYQATPRNWDYREDVSAVAYAESADGYCWTKPCFNRDKTTGVPNNLCDLGLHSPSVFIDPASPDERRYRAVGCGRPGDGSRGFRYGYYSAYSADGLKWEFDGANPQWEGGDVITSIYHPGRGKGIISLKNEVWSNRLFRRCIKTAEYQNGIYGRPVKALYPDEYDDVAAAQRGHFTTDYYGMGMLAAGQSTVGFIWNFRHDLPYSRSSAGARGNSDITLVFQESEGDCWLPMPGRPSFLSHHDLPWTSQGWIHSSSQPVLVGDEHRLYFSGCNYDHALYIEGGKPSERWLEWMKQEARTGITFARWPKFRLFGFESTSEASFQINLAEVTEASELRLNYKTRRGGRIRIEVVGDTQCTLENSVCLEGDATEALVAWKHGTIIQAPKERKLSVRVVLEMAAVYAYQITPRS